MTRWLTRTEALRELGVRPQTLYAYASRGQIDVSRDPSNPQRSLYRGEDIAALIARRKRGRRPQAIAAGTIWLGEPIIDTAISTIQGGRLYYRGRDAVEMAKTATLEETAALLWGMQAPPHFPTEHGFGSGDRPMRSRAYLAIAEAAATGIPTLGRTTSVLCEEAALLVGRLCSGFDAASGQEPMHVRLSRGWKLRDSAVDLVRRALVSVADQELTNSVFAARVTISSGGSLAACMLAGIAAVSGPLHGGGTVRVQQLLKEIERSGADELVQRHLQSGSPIPGFGHYMYADGDPRAAALLASFTPRPRHKRTIEKVCASTGLAPNIDLALAVLADSLDFPEDAPFALFAIGRSVGWLAHGMEQVVSKPGMMIRPRARYIGPQIG